jgi:pyruvate/2-oxoglutarate dehydrogenase complex dihydrolipoamide acyltransferase (E2) component
MLAFLMSLVKTLDAWGLLPRAFIDNDPLFASMFVANLGSLGMDAGQHHLYEYGNIPIFCVIGKKKHSFVVDDAGGVKAREIYPLRFTFDERIEDGLYCLKAIESLKQRIESPS